MRYTLYIMSAKTFLAVARAPAAPAAHRRASLNPTLGRMQSHPTGRHVVVVLVRGKDFATVTSNCGGHNPQPASESRCHRQLI